MVRTLVVLMCGLLVLAGCSGGAVVFAPTPPPPDTSPLRYVHPSGAFSVDVPRNWSAVTTHTTTLAAVSFAVPHSSTPTLTFAVVNLGSAINSQALQDAIDRYQRDIRPDTIHYSEQERSAMGDGSWRLTGLRQTVGGETEPVNTFVEAAGSLIGVAEVRLPDVGGAVSLAELQTIVNSFAINAQASLPVSDLTALAFASRTGLEVIHLATWTTPVGVFFITGEVANYGMTTISDIPIRAVLKTEDGTALIEAVDTVMGYGIPPGGFAPFSLRFGQGQPGAAVTYDLTLGGADWQPVTDRTLYGVDELTWTDESAFTDDGQLVVSGSVTNISDQPVRNPRAVVSVFNAAQNVIAAAYTDLALSPLQPGESEPFQLFIPEMGGEAVNYIVTIQG
ncbi:MAG: DUF3426 domain-containing protein, partial [Anaerolineae bacterium]|nr:DUF3426 domain-containing protein [Anaerolineae bacterium]